MVCQEGEDYKPKQIMGIYVYCKEVVLESAEYDIHPSLLYSYASSLIFIGRRLTMGDNREEVGVTSVTHFNVVHFQCHKDAAKADKKLKPPKTEWEGATIRNSHTLCNNLFPIWSTTVPDTLYASKVMEYWSVITRTIQISIVFAELF
jgi:E3 ubiquitin-protein ligase UBR4